ncbi:hypothetical protein GA0071314_2977 [Halomonas sp. HL-93]|nr:hypothetical protein GA0071314_2977 [Halomonas sp. HL-93]SNY97147.1 hypothetical protein SAMN04488142_1724 [Halomonas sp. hl-4]
MILSQVTLKQHHGTSTLVAAASASYNGSQLRDTVV